MLSLSTCNSCLCCYVGFRDDDDGDDCLAVDDESEDAAMED